MNSLAAEKKASTAYSIHFTLFLTVSIWASTFISIKAAIAQVPPNTLAFLRFFIAGILLTIYSLLTKQPMLAKKDWPLGAFSGLTGVALYNFLQNQGLRWAGATEASILAAMTPVFLALLAFFILKESITKKQIFGILMAFTGSAVVATNGSLQTLSMDAARLFGDFLILMTGIFFAMYSISLKKLLAVYPPEAVLTFSTITGCLFLLPTVIFEAPNILEINLTGWLHILYLGIPASGLSYLLWNKSLTKVPAVTASSYIYLIPVIAAIIAFFFLNEVPTAYTISGGILTLIGTYFAQ